MGIAFRAPRAGRAGDRARETDRDKDRDRARDRARDKEGTRGRQRPPRERGMRWDITGAATAALSHIPVPQTNPGRSDNLPHYRNQGFLYNFKSSPFKVGSFANFHLKFPAWFRWELSRSCVNFVAPGDGALEQTNITLRENGQGDAPGAAA